MIGGQAMDMLTVSPHQAVFFGCLIEQQCKKKSAGSLHPEQTFLKHFPSATASSVSTRSMLND